MTAPWLLHLAVGAAAVVTISGHGITGVSNRLSGTVASHTVGPRETLTAISARFGVGVATIRRDNQLAPDAAIVAGQTLRLDSRHVVPRQTGGEVLIVNVPQRMLFHFADGSTLAAAYPVAVGRATWPTPIGAFTVAAMEQHPVWDVPASIQDEMRRAGHLVVTTVPPGPGNPLGDYWIGLSLPGIGIHGTPYPTSIYAATTHGCVRLHADDIAALFPGITLGTPGRIVFEPIMVAAVDGAIFLEAHRNVYRRGEGNTVEVLRSLERGGARLDWDAVERTLTARDGVPRPVGVSNERSEGRQ